MIKLFRNNKKKWIVQNGEETFEFDTIKEADKKRNELNVEILNRIVGSCEDCGRSVLNCECDNDFI